METRDLNDTAESYLCAPLIYYQVITDVHCIYIWSSRRASQRHDKAINNRKMCNVKYDLKVEFHEIGCLFLANHNFHFYITHIPYNIYIIYTHIYIYINEFIANKFHIFTYDRLLQNVSPISYSHPQKVLIYKEHIYIYTYIVKD